MSTFLFASIPVPAHTTNPTPFAQRLVDRGHRVLWYAGAAFHDQISAIGAEPMPYVDAEDFGGVTIEERWPEFVGLEGAGAIKRAFAEIFVGEAAKRVADLRTILGSHDVDAMLCDGLMYGVGLAHELGGPAWATFGDGPLPFFDADTPPFGPGFQPMRGPIGRLRNRSMSYLARKFIFSAAQKRYDSIRTELDLPRSAIDVLSASTSPYLHLQGCTPGFEYPRTSIPSHSHWVGALRPDPPTDWTPPAWWHEVITPERPVVLVSQGSIRPDLSELIAPSIRGLADSDALVIVTTGQAEPAAVLEMYGSDLPGNVRVEKHVPYDLLLPHVNCFVTNGGYTGVTLALAHGVRLVQAGNTEEKSEIAARIDWTGVGVRLGTTRPSPEAVRDGVSAVLTQPRYLAAARRIQTEMADHDAGTEGAILLEELARAQAPVTATPAAITSRVGASDGDV